MSAPRSMIPWLAAVGLVLIAHPAAAAPPEDFLLGQSAKTGAVCQAIRDYQDPAAQERGAAAWAVRCRGWSGALGHLYLYSRAPESVANGLWRKALADRAHCEGPSSLSLPGLAGATESRCATVKGGSPYVAYTSPTHGAAAEGFAPLADMLQAGLRVVAGVASPPRLATDAQASAVGDAGGSSVSLSDAADAANGPSDRGKEFAYTQNQAWRFASAEQNWRPLALAASDTGLDQAEAFLNWALAYSNLGRFDQADKLFAQADDQVKRLGDPYLASLALNYHALDALNRRDLDSAKTLAAQGIEARRHQREVAETAQPLTVSGGAGGVVIGPVLADALNRRDRTGSFAPRNLSADERLRIPDAQAELVIGQALDEQGDVAGARDALEKGEKDVASPSVLNSVVWLKAQIEAELARLDLNAGQPAAAKARLNGVLTDVHHGADSAYLIGSPVEAYLLFQLGRAQAAAGESDQAMADYDHGFALFRQARGSLGPSADAAGVYFDLLLAKRESDPTHARAYDERFFAASQSIVSEATASTVSELAKRIGAGGDAAAGTARALEDTRRLIEVKQAAINDLAGQPATAQTAATRSADEADLKSLNDQATVLEGQLLNTDPRYGQLEFTAVSLDDLQKALRPGEAYVKIVLLGTRSYGLAVTPDKVRPYAIDLTRATAADTVKVLRKPFDGRTLSRFDVDTSHKLYEALLGPAQTELSGVTHLIYDPDGALLSLPVATLVTDQASVDLMAQRLATIKAKGRGFLTYDGVNWLGRNVDTSLVVSAPSFMQSRNFKTSDAASPFLGFGDAIIGSADDPRLFSAVVTASQRGGEVDFCQDQRHRMAGLRRLTETADEVRTVGGALGAGAGDEVLGADFTDTGVESRKDLNQFRVIYFATHGLLPRPGWCLPEPALVTSLGAGDSDALLQASSILNLKLDADLVVLSACNTGGGSFEGGTGPMDDGDALGGLTRAFIYAGSRGLVVSHWEVDSASTQALMTGMFTAAKPGESVGEAEALRRSELRLMDSQDHSHPYYWAAFTIVGDGARPMPVKSGAPT